MIFDYGIGDDGQCTYKKNILTLKSKYSKAKDKYIVNGKNLCLTFTNRKKWKASTCVTKTE